MSPFETDHDALERLRRQGGKLGPSRAQGSAPAPVREPSAEAFVSLGPNEKPAHLRRPERPSTAPPRARAQGSAPAPYLETLSDEQAAARRRELPRRRIWTVTASGRYSASAPMVLVFYPAPPTLELLEAAVGRRERDDPVTVSPPWARWRQALEAEAEEWTRKRVGGRSWTVAEIVAKACLHVLQASSTGTRASDSVTIYHEGLQIAFALLEEGSGA